MLLRFKAAIQATAVFTTTGGSTGGISDYCKGQGQNMGCEWHQVFSHGSQYDGNVPALLKIGFTNLSGDLKHPLSFFELVLWSIDFEFKLALLVKAMAKNIYIYIKNVFWRSRLP